MKMRLASGLLLVLAAMVAGAAPNSNTLVNGDFTRGLSGWKTEGRVRITDISGGHAAEIGPGPGSIRQRYPVPGLRIMTFEANVHLDAPRQEAFVSVECFDRRGKLVMTVVQKVDAAKGTVPAGAEIGIYFKTQATTAFVEAIVENRSGGVVRITGAKLYDYERGRVDHRPDCDLDAYLRPIWHGDHVVDETVLLLSEKGGPARGRLLFAPRRVVSVTDGTRRAHYAEGKDYRVEGQEIVALPGSLIPTMHDYVFPHGEFPWLSVAGRHILVTYDHDDRWSGSVAAAQTDRLPRTLSKLRAHAPVKIVALGDSITLGMNVSGVRGDPPYMPAWADLFAHGLRTSFDNPHVAMVNVALGGMTARWGLDNAHDAVATLHPDLVLIGFGMNDFWSVVPDDFARQIADTMAIIRRENPDAEFVLISSIRFDPAYTTDRTYVGHMTGYASALRRMSGPGVAFLDMTAISEALYRAKPAKGLLADPMHPDDFLARWYAQGLMAIFATQG